MKKSLVILKPFLIICISVMLFCACQASIEQTNEQYDNTTIAEESIVPEQTTVSAIESPPVISDNVLTQDHWKPINEYVQFLGKSMFSVIDDLDSFSYDWLKDGSQYFVAEDSNVLLFSNPAWEEGSTCSAIVFYGYNVLPYEWDGTEKNLKDYFGEGYSYHEANGTTSAFYEYNFKNLKVLFYQGKNGAIIPSENCILLKPNQNNIELQDVKIRDHKKYSIAEINESHLSTFKEYVSSIGKEKEDIITEGLKLLEAPYEAGSWGDITAYSGECYLSDSKVVFKFETGLFPNDSEVTTNCRYIFIPVYSLFPEFNDSITMKDLIDYGNGISWGYDEGYVYGYECGDKFIYIPSGRDGSVNINEYVMIKE
jgi:hypothetical protein